MSHLGCTLIDRPQETRGRLIVSVAESEAEIRAAQRLRYRVFVEEMGARIGGRRSALEQDRFDPYCEHLIVRDTISDRVIGTYRFLTAERARQLGSFMSEREFDLTPLFAIRGRMAELGRACIDPDYRGGTALLLLWSGIARHVQKRGASFLFGCASIAMDDGGVNAVRAYKQLVQHHLAPPEYRVLPRIPLLSTRGPDGGRAAVPTLLKGYLRIGGWICGEAAWDPEFNTADLLVLLPLEHIAARYARHFLRDSSNLLPRVASSAAPQAFGLRR